MATFTVGPSGRDYTSLNAAIQAADDNPASRGARTLILVDYAVYTEVLDFQSPSGGWQIPCVIQAADISNRPVIQSTGAAQACLGGGAYRGTAVGETEIDGLIFSGWSSASNGVCYFGAQGLVLTRCKFTGNTGRVCIRWCAASASRYGIVDRCEYDTSGSTGAGAAGIVLAYGSLTKVTNNKAIGPSDVQFLYEPSSGPGVVEHNSLLLNLNSGGLAAIVMVGTARGNLAKNLGTTASYGIYNWGGTNVENYFNGPFSSRYTGTDGGSNLDTDPLFTDTGTGDLTLQITSPAIRSLSRSADTLFDITGAARSDPTDAGAYEMTFTTTVASITVVDEDTIKLVLAGVVASDGTWTDAGNYTITPPGGAPAITVSVAAITDAGASITLTTNEHKNGGAYNVAWAGITNIADGSAGYTGVGTSPLISTTAPLTASTVEVVFNEAMTDNAALVLAGNYTLTRSGGSTVVSSVARTSATRVVLTCADALWAGYTYTLAVSGPTDLAGNAISDTESLTPLTAAFIAATCPTTNTVLLRFAGAAIHASMGVPGNYTITRVLPHLAPSAPTISGAVAAQVGSELRVTLTTTDHFQLQEYLVAWTGVTNLANGSGQYVGVGPQAVVTVSGGFYPPDVVAYTAPTESRASRMVLDDWDSAAVARSSDIELLVVMPSGDSGDYVDLLLVVPSRARPTRAVKRRAYQHP